MTTNAERVVQIGERVWGANWASGMGDLTKVNHRTLTRIYAAAQAGEEYPAARGVLAALYDCLAAVVDDLEPFSR
jgi:hypothetical protein